MSEPYSQTVNPFDVDLADESIERQALGQALRLAQGFKLFFGVSEQPAQIPSIIAALQEDLPELKIREIELREPVENLLHELRQRLADPPPDALFVRGLEPSFLSEADAAVLLAEMNGDRDVFPAVVPCPLVLWISDWVFSAIARGARDFFAVRSGLYYFASPHAPALATLSESQSSSDDWGNSWEMANLSLAEKLARIERLQKLVQELAHDQSAQNLHAQGRFLHQIGTLYELLGRLAEAEAAYQESLQIWRSLGDASLEGRTYRRLANVYRVQGRLDQAEATYQHSLQISHALKEDRDMAETLMGLGTTYRAQGRYAEAEEAYQNSLQIRRKFGDRLGEGKTLNNLGTLYYSQGRFAEAEVALEDSLRIGREIGDHVGEGKIRNNLGAVYQALGRYMEAEESYQHSLQIRRKFGDRVGESCTLDSLAELREAQGKLREAAEFARQAVEVCEALGPSAMLQETRDTLSRIETKIATY